MSSSDSLSSWHPAFMPHTAPTKDTAPVEAPADPKPTNESITTTEAQSLDSPKATGWLEDSDSRISDSEMITKAHQSKVESEAAQHVPDDSFMSSFAAQQDHEMHPEWSNLKDALTKSLNSPGGVEMNESPWHAEASEGATEQAFDPGLDRSDIPSQGPGRPQSFARSAQAINWGEDDEVDQEWNLQRSNTDVFKSMGAIDRSNSFPQVPPSHVPEEMELAHSQAEEIVGEAGKTPNGLFDEEDAQQDDFFSQQATSNVTTRSQEVPFGTDESAPDLGDRYEEGLPLMRDVESTQVEPVSATTQPKSVMFADDTPGEDDFFSGIGEEGDFGAHSLSRKSTMQVMDSLHFNPSEEVLDDETDTSRVNASQSAMEKSTGGGIAVSASTVLSQVLGASDLELSQEVARSGEPSEEDLAAKWKAALDNDEFLDDDGFLDEDGLLEDDDNTKAAGLDPSTLFGSDDEGFLEDDEEGASSLQDQLSPNIPAPVLGSNGQTIGFDTLASSAQLAPQRTQSRYTPANASQTISSAPNPHAYTPTAPLFTNIVPQGPQVPGNATYGVPAPVAPPVNNFRPTQPTKPDLPKASSFSNQAKAGYTSPYDLPMDVVIPKKRASMQQMSHSYNNPTTTAQSGPPAGPPRSTSMYAQGPPPSRGSATSVSPPTSIQPKAVPNQAPPTLKSKSSFFEELPMTSRPKPPGRYTPQPQTTSPALPTTSFLPQGQPGPPPPRSQPQALHQGLVAPPPASPFAPLGEVPPQVPVNASRYSPAPPQTHTNTPPPPPSGTRYAAAPPIRSQSSSNTPPVPPPAPFAHQPRTSSPLAHFERSSESRSYAGVSTIPPAINGQYRRGSSGFEPGHRTTLSITPEVDEQGYNARNVSTLDRQYSNQQDYPSIPPRTLSNLNTSQRATSSYLPNEQAQELVFTPPQRSQTQSPGKFMGPSRIDMSAGDPYQRPVSVHGPASPREANSMFSPLAQAAAPVIAPKTRTRGLSQNFTYVEPTDGRQHDPLKRWRGGPVFTWGVGGTVITSFPKEVPRYGITGTAPMMFVNPGEVKIRSLKDIYPLEARLSSFPGPLKGKAKKKEVISWLTTGIELLEKDSHYLQSTQQLSHEDKRMEERVLLWKILRVLVENDGILEGNPQVDKVVRAVLSPGLDSENTEFAPQYTTGADLSGIHRPDGARAHAEAVDPAAVDELRRHLLRGEREKAVWDAVDKRLWAHAMLISNTVSRNLYKQVAQEFVQKEVKGIGQNTESLAALYEVFAGNHEEIVDELVPPSARAGFQMVSASGPTGPAKDALEGLDRWRETLGLVLSNRSPDDGQAILALGRLLSGYGRAEAAHICFLFARAFSVFGGVDDPASNIVLVGSDHLRQPAEFDKELEPILLSEVYEYAMALAAPSSVSTAVPHLAVYKLRHALVLAETGQRDKALQYCEAVATTITSQTRRSPYHHALLVASLDDLSKRLKQSPRDGASSWISKPSIDKVSGSVWAKFNKFVAGDENDAEAPSDGAAGLESGPFARIAGGTPTISRSPSNADIFASHPAAAVPSYSGAVPIPPSRTASKYAPGASFAPPVSQDGGLASSYGSQGPTAYPSSLGQVDQPAYGTPPQPSQLASRFATGTHDRYAPSTTSQYAPSSYTPSHPSTPNMQPITSESLQSSPQSIQNARPPLPVNGRTSPENSYQPQMMGYQPSESGSYNPPESTVPLNSNTFSSFDSTSGYQPPESSGGYQPPESSGYEPPSYEPNAMGEEPDSPIDTKPKKKSFMDDDEDDIPALKKPTEKTKAEKDREADEAFRRAAEEDAKRSAAAPAKKGWGLGGWFGGKKEAAPEVGQPNKPIKAKLGEESSFYYDPELKRWVNKKAGKDDTAAKGATPPPPRAGPPRSVSGTGPPSARGTPPPSGPPSGPPSRQASGSNAPAFPSPPTSSGTDGLNGGSLAPPLMKRTVSNGSVGSASGAAGSLPPRPSTGMSNASSIDDLLGPPQARKGAAKAKKKGRGYVDVMGDSK